MTRPAPPCRIEPRQVPAWLLCIDFLLLAGALRTGQVQGMSEMATFVLWWGLYVCWGLAIKLWRWQWSCSAMNLDPDLPRPLWSIVLWCTALVLALLQRSSQVTPSSTEL